MRMSGFVLSLGVALTAAAQDDPQRVHPLDTPATPPAITASASVWEESLQCGSVAPASPFDGPLWERPKLLGNWGGWRDELAAHGIGVDLNTTQYYQGVADGGLGQEFRYGGRNDYYVNIDGEKLGVVDRTFLTLHGETLYGESVDGLTGALMSSNTGGLFPLPGQDITALTAVKVTHIVDEHLVVFGGKINFIDEYAINFGAGKGQTGFMNMGLTFNPIVARQVPYSTLGAGLAVMQEQEPIFTFMVMDALNTPTTSGFDTLFSKGSVLLASAILPVELNGLRGHHAIGGAWSSRSYVELDQSPFVLLPPPVGVPVNRSSGSWGLFYNFDQALWASPDNPKQQIGVFAQTGIADRQTSPLSWFTSIGISGTSLLPNRCQDTWGVGYFYLGVSDTLQTTLAPFPAANLRDEQGVELYYNIAVTPWMHITPDLQIIEPSRVASETSLVAGLRARIDF